MILIADSGATKTSWALLKDQKVILQDTAGFNPYYMDASVLQRILFEEMIPEIVESLWGKKKEYLKNIFTFQQSLQLINIFAI